MIKLIATDIDGTLVEDGSTNINPEIFDIIRKLKEKGIIFVVASGRQYPSIRNLFSPVAEDIIFIAENGAHVMCRETIMSVTEMDRAKAEELIHDFRTKTDCQMVVSTSDGAYTESSDPAFMDWMINGYKNKITVVEDALKEDITIIKASLCKMDGIREVADELIPKWKPVFKCCMAGEQWLDIMDNTVDKGQAIKIIQDFFQISCEDTMAFGDNSNDVGMLKRARYSYAVETASEDAKASAKHIAKSYKENGVLNVLKGLLQAE